MRIRHPHSRSSSASRLRPAFTLIELLMVVSIIALLVALLVPAVSSVVHRAKIAQVVSDVQGMANAADSFKAQYHVYPPSSITLYERAADWNPMTNPSAAPHRAMIRRIFGTTFNFNIDRDINGNGNMTDTIVLDGDECLVFFLGGIPMKDPTTGQIGLIGFASNNQNPFDRAAKSRTQFFKNFDASRLGDRDGDGMPEYHDLFNPPGEGPAYAYISTTNASNLYIAGHLTFAGMTSFYYQGTQNSPWKPDGFQIISAGADHTFGTGGNYTKDSGIQGNDRDNITNFSGGALNE